MGGLRPCYIGVDPGASGAIAVLVGGTVSYTELGILTRRDLIEWVQQWTVRRDLDPTALVERVHSMPKQGVRSMFAFGQAYERVLMALTAAGVPFDEATPQEWQREIGVTLPKNATRTERKRRLKQRAQELFPGEKVTLATADALLIAEVCRRRGRHVCEHNRLGWRCTVCGQQFDPNGPHDDDRCGGERVSPVCPRCNGRGWHDVSELAVGSAMCAETCQVCGGSGRAV